MTLFMLAIALAGPEICDGIDNDGDLVVDEAPAFVYADLDGDGHGDPSALVPVANCALPPPNSSTNPNDCDDTNNLVFPSAFESCDGRDNNCDGQIDEGGCPFTSIQYRYTFGDSTYMWSDSFLRQYLSKQECLDYGYRLVIMETPAEGTFIDGFAGSTRSWIGLEDLNTNDTFLWIDNTVPSWTDWGSNEPRHQDGDCAYHRSDAWWTGDCDSSSYKGYGICEVECTQKTWYRDLDGDGFGSSAPPDITSACQAPSGFVANNLDCDDAASAIHPSATEVCDGVDNDCDGDTDGGLSTLYYTDNDGDGYGDQAAVATLECTPPAGAVANNTDCNDHDSAISPGATESCDNVDNDCNPATPEIPPSTWYLDGDDDGYGLVGMTMVQCDQPVGYAPIAGDCDDIQAMVNPGAVEVCDAFDNDCDPNNDLLLTTWYADHDGDNYGDPNHVAFTCNIPPGYIAIAGDCNDADSGINPGVSDLCNGIDDDCDTRVDEDEPPTTYYQDTDNDSFGDPATGTSSCTAPSGSVTNDRDCDDTRNFVFPDATEICDGFDNDCDLQIDESVRITFYADLDGDNHGNPLASTAACTPPTGYIVDNTDCNDNEPLAWSGNIEVCDNVDNDCNGQTDENAPNTYFRDDDQDGYGDPSTAQMACDPPAGHVTNADDCNDAEAAAWTGAPEICDNIDNDCNGQTDENAPNIYYQDQDGDSFGDAANTTQGCMPPTGYVSDHSDCDDSRATAFPGAAELCNMLDDDCDGEVDNSITSIQWYLDADGDGYGATVGQLECSQPAGQAALPGDCDDSDAEVHPAAIEVCDNVDNNCNGQVDSDAIDRTMYYTDSDGDGFGDEATRVLVCTAGTHSVLNGEDCDDLVFEVHPDADEICDNIDNNCDGIIDEDAIDRTSWWADRDGDLYGDQDSTELLLCIAPDDTIDNNDDCDDLDPAAYPGAEEQCNHTDNDCDGTLDNDVVFRTWFIDNDGDSYGNIDGTDVTCAPPHGQVGRDGDCDDSNAGINPAAEEVCDGHDNNCDGEVDVNALDSNRFYADVDQDGYGNPGDVQLACGSAPAGTTADSTDCDDTRPDVNPGAPEVCDLLDNNCDGQNNEHLLLLDYYPDADGDQFGDESASPEPSCRPIPTKVEDNTDCNDLDPHINPDAVDVPGNNIDEDCDGQDATELPPTVPIDTDTDVTDTAADTGNGTVIAPSTGCQCDQGGSPALGLLLLAPLLLVQRRSR